MTIASDSDRPVFPAAIPVAAGVGLRFRHHRPVINERPMIPWFEVHTENYMGGGAIPAYLDAIRRDYPVSLHGVGLSLGGADGIDEDHLRRVRQVVERVEPGLVSDHLSWSAIDGINLAELLPLPLTEETLAVVCRNVDRVQEGLGRRILMENPSSYIRYRHTTIPEPDFLVEVARRTGCGILCDVNNIYVSACNHGWDASAYLAALPPAMIEEIHLAGHSTRILEDGNALRIDDHGSIVCPAVWRLYAEALSRFGPVPTLIEWDTDVPPIEVLMAEAAIAQSLMDETAKGTADVA